MIAGSVARRYARALLDIGLASKSSDAIGKELDRVGELFHGSKDLLVTLENPIFPLDQRKNVVNELARRLALSTTVRNFMMLLLDRGRIAALPAIAREHRILVDQAIGRVRVTVTTAMPMDAATEQRLKGALERQTGRVVLLDKREDPALIGGIVTQIGDLVYDGSVRTQLDGMRSQLLAE